MVGAGTPVTTLLTAPVELFSPSAKWLEPGANALTKVTLRVLPAESVLPLELKN